MATTDHDLLWLIDLRADEGLGPTERELLARRLEAGEAAGGELASESRRIERLHALLAADRVEVRPGFRESVMASLPVAPWEAAQGLGAWRYALGLLAALVVLAVGLTAVGAPQMESSPVLGVVSAVADFAVAATLSGAGMLAASWRGVGIALGEALGVPEQVVFGLGIVALNGLLFTLLRSAWRRRATVEAEDRS